MTTESIERCTDKAMAYYRPADYRSLIIGRLSADYRLIQKPDILTLISKDCIGHTNILLHNVTG